MLVLPTSANAAVIFEQSQGSPLWALFGYVTIGLLFGCGYCVWEMVLGSMLGRPARRSRWVALLVAAGLFGSGVFVDSYLTTAAVFNDKLETTWGFVLSPWLFIAFIPVAATLVVMRLADSRTAAGFAHVPAPVWWLMGLAVVAGYGAAALWSGGREPAVEGAATVGGVILALASVLSLVAVGVNHRTRREGPA